MKKTSTGIILLFAASLFLSIQAKSQLSGIYTVPGSYTSVASAISDLNIQGVNAAVTINIAAGYTETAPVGGLVVNTISGASATNPIIFQKNGSGANPLISAYIGTATPASAAQDGIWRFIGSDFITIDGINLLDLNLTNPATMEFGYGFFKASATNGCQNNTIKNCMITLNRINNAAGISPAGNGSRGIELVNALSAAHTTSLAANSSAGTNSFNKFYSNIIRNCNTGIMLSSYYDSANSDNNNNIGGTTVATGNTIINFGGGGTLSGACGIDARYQVNLSVRYNLVNNNTSTGVNHTEALTGILFTGLYGGNVSVAGNTITLNGGGSTQTNAAIKTLPGAGSVGTALFENNLIANCSYSTATSGQFYGILNSGASGDLTVRQNTFFNNSTAATSGTYCSILNLGAAGTVSITNNSIDLGTFSAASTSLELYGICNNIQPFSNNFVGLSMNAFQNCNFTGSTGGTGPVTLISNMTVQGNINVLSNTFNNLTVKTSGDVTFISNNTATYYNTISSNSVITGFSNPAGGTLYGYYCNTAGSGNVFSSNNNFSNITLTGTGSFYGMFEASGRVALFNDNVISSVSAGNGTLCGIRHSISSSDINNNTISGFSGAGTIYGIFGGGPGINTPNNVWGNLLHSLTSSGAGTVCGIYHAGTSSTTIGQNKIYNLLGTNAASQVNGIYCNNTSYAMVHNNIIGNLRAPAATGSSCSVSGIEISAGYYNKLYHNTVLLNATSSGASFGSAAVCIQPAIGFEMNNNIFINTSAPTGTGVSAAFMGNSLTAGQYNPVSDHNLFYAGTPAANRAIYYNGTTTYSTLALYKAMLVLADVHAVTENVSFLSTTGASADFLHIDPTVPSLIESGAIAVPGYSVDFDGQPRQGSLGYTGTGSAPDIGADEYNQHLCTQGSSTGILSATSLTLCEAKTFTVNTTNNSLFQGINYEWKTAATPGGPYTAVPGGTGAITTSYTSAVLNTPGTFYYILSSTCAVTGNTASTNPLTVTVNALPTGTLSANSNTLCANQPLILNAISNGTGFLWTGPNFSSAVQNPTLAFVGTLGGGTYSVKITSNEGCMKTYTIPITVTPPANITAVAVPSVICAGDTAILYTSGSAATYTWSSQQNTSTVAVTPALSSVYTVSAQISACPLSVASVSVIVNPRPVFSLAVTPTLLCVGSPATLIVTGPDTYSWSTGATGTSVVTSGLATAYSVTGTNSFGCALTQSVLNNPLPPVSVTALSNSICLGSFANISATGASSYSWSTGAGTPSILVQPAANQSFTVTGLSAEGCSATAVIGIHVFSNPTLLISPASPTVCEQEPFTLTASGATNYTWLPVNVNAALITQLAVTNTVFIVTGTDANNCSTTATVYVVVTECVGIKKFTAQKDISVYPNPSNGFIAVSFPSEEQKKIVITNLASEIICETESTSSIEHFDLSGHAKGIYFVRVGTAAGWSNYKLIVN